MSSRRLRTNSPIFFNAVYVIRVEFAPNIEFVDATIQFTSMNRKAFSSMIGTWGFSRLFDETTEDYSDSTSWFKYSESIRRRGYVCFAEEADAMCYRLTHNITMQRVHIWPKKATFTISEFIPD